MAPSGAAPSKAVPLPGPGASGAEGSRAAELAARRSEQAKRRAAVARLAEARAHDEAARRHEAAILMGVGDPAEHRRLAEEHRGAAQAAWEAAAPPEEDGQNRRNG